MWCHCYGFDSRLQRKNPAPRMGSGFFGAGNRNRTGTDFTPRDFKSLVSTYSTMPADINLFILRTAIWSAVSCCVARRMSSAFKSLRPSSTAATRSARFFRLGCPVLSLPINRLRRSPTPALAYAPLFLPSPAARSNAAATGSARIAPPGVYRFHHNGESFAELIVAYFDLRVKGKPGASPFITVDPNLRQRPAGNSG